MKKSLLAVAALGAFASAAQAQSSVTVYGIVDVGYLGANSRTATGTRGTSPTTGVINSTSSAIGSSAESTSRLGFKGTEDLGGGTSAFFTLEMKITPDGNQVINSSSTQDRQAFVGLKKKGLGDFALGTQYTIVHNAVAATDAGQQNNVTGDLIYSAGTGTAAQTNANSAFAGGYSYSIRQANALTLNTDVISGFKGHLMFVQNNSNTNQYSSGATSSGGTTNASGWGIGVDYTWQKLFLTANYQAFTARTNTSATTAFTLFSPGQNNSQGSNVNDNQQYYGATYDFGILKAYAQYLSRSSTAQNNSLYYQKYSAEQIGVRSYITPTIEGWASAGAGNFTVAGTTNPKANIYGYQLGANYWLSKRTNLYAIYGQVAQSNSNPSSGATVSTSSTAMTSYNGNNYAIGLRHTF